MATYKRLATHEPPEQEVHDDEEDHGKSSLNSDTPSTTDIEVDDIKDTEVGNTMRERQRLLPTDSDLHKAVSRRKAQLVKVTLAAIVCLLQLVALPVFYGELENFWGEESPTIMMSAKYSLFGCFIVSCLFTPMLIAMFGIKVIFVSGSLSVCLFVSANFVPLRYSAIPASMLSGLVIGPFLVSQLVFITNCAYRYCKTLTSCDHDAIINITNGLYLAISLAAPFLSNCINLLFLQTPNISNDKLGNSSTGCEPHSCLLYSGYKHELFILPDPENYEFSFHRIQALLGSHLALSFIGLVMSALMFNSHHPLITQLSTSKCTAPPKQFRWSTNPKTNLPDQPSLREHFRCSTRKWRCVFVGFKDKNLLLVLPLFVYVGLQQGLVYNVFIKDVLGCRLDHRRVYIMRLLISLSSVVMALPAAILSRYAGRFRLSLPAVASQLSLVLTMLLWQPGLAEWGVLYVIGILWGCVDAVWHVITMGLVGRMFRSSKDVAYSHLRLSQMTGYLIMDLLRSFFCTTFVLSIFIVIFLSSVVSFMIFEIRIRLQLQRSMVSTNSSDVTLTPDHSATWVPGLSPHVPRQRETLNYNGCPR